MTDKYKSQNKYKAGAVKTQAFDAPIAEVEAFNAACRKLGLQKATLFRELMKQIVAKAAQQ